MLITFFLSLLVSLYTTTLINSNPLMLMLLIILISLIMSITFSMIMSSWYAFFIFLIYVGGMLVMFAYFAATTPNQSNMKTKMSTYMTMSTTIILFASTFMLDPHISENKYDQLLTLYTNYESWTLIMITLILLMTMLIVVKITTRSKGPMRSFM